MALFWVLRSGVFSADLPERCGPCTTCYNRFRRWTKAGIWDLIMDVVAAVHDGNIQMIDGTSRARSSLCYHFKKVTRIDIWVEAEAD